MTLKILWLLIGLKLGLPGVDPDTNYAVAKVRKGENIEMVLNRYLLTPHECNVEAFIKINNIKDKNVIYAGHIYKLPLAIMPFNGVTIRSSIGITDYELAKKIEKLNLDLLSAGIRDQHYKNNNRIWVPTCEFDCTSDNTPIPSISIAEESASGYSEFTSNKDVPTGTELKRKGIKTINVPLMGRGYDVVHIEDYSLSGQVFYIISGHGGPDPGAMYHGHSVPICEDEYAYDVALRLARNLMQHGATVEMIVQDPSDGIRDDEILLCDNTELTLGKYKIPLNQKERLRDRVKVINNLYRKYKKEGYKIHKAIEIHVDSRSQDKRQDVYFYYNKNNPASKKLAQSVRDVFDHKYSVHQKNRGYHGFIEDRGIYMVRNVEPTMVFVELANIKNKADQQRLLKNTNRQALANWLFEGLIR